MPKRTATTPTTPSKKIKLQPEEVPSQTLYVKNLNDQVHPKTLKHNLYLLFSTYGDVIQISNKHRGQAHILFDSVENSNLAMKCLQSEDFFNKQLVIRYSKTESKLLRIDESPESDL